MRLDGPIASDFLSNKKRFDTDYFHNQLIWIDPVIRNKNFFQEPCHRLWNKL